MNRFLFVTCLGITAWTWIPETALACPLPDVGVAGGLNLNSKPQGGTKLGGRGIIQAGWSFHRCLRWPARAEVFIGSGSRGSLSAQGVEAVHVSSFNIDTGALAGPSVEFGHDRTQGFGAELLAGPMFRVTRTATTVFETTDVVWAPTLLVRLMAGMYFRQDFMRIFLRTAINFPTSLDIDILLGMAFQI